MTGLVLKDMLVMRKTLKTYVLFLAFYLLLAVIGLFPISTITAVTQIIIMMLPLSAFSFDELAKWDRYALTFPTGRRSLVGARYLFTLVMAAAATLYSLVACVVLSIGKGQSAMAENLLSLMVSLGLGLIIADILLPLCYKLGVERPAPICISSFSPPAPVLRRLQVGALRGHRPLLSGPDAGEHCSGRGLPTPSDPTPGTWAILPHLLPYHGTEGVLI